MLTLYARKERSTDSVLNDLCPRHTREDVVIYRDEACTQHYATFRWDMSNKPTRRNKYVDLNCYRWKLQWVPTAADTKTAGPVG